MTVVIFYAILYTIVLVAVGFCLWMAERPTGPDVPAKETR